MGIYENISPWGEVYSGAYYSLVADGGDGGVAV